MQDLGVCWEARSFACQEVPASSPWHSAAGLWSKDKPRDRKGGISQRYFQIDPQESCRFVTGRRRFGLYPIQVCWWCNPSLSGHGLQPFLPGGGGVPCRTRAGIQCSGCKSHPRAAPLTSKPCEIAGPGQPPPWPAFAGWAGLSHGLGRPSSQLWQGEPRWWQGKPCWWRGDRTGAGERRSWLWIILSTCAVNAGLLFCGYFPSLAQRECIRPRCCFRQEFPHFDLSPSDTKKGVRRS